MQLNEIQAANETLQLVVAFRHVECKNHIRSPAHYSYVYIFVKFIASRVQKSYQNTHMKDGTYKLGGKKWSGQTIGQK